MTRAGFLVFGLLLAGCGAQRDLQPQAGKTLPPPPFGRTDPPTAEQEPAPGSPAQEGDEDVLEDTPDFLQETPEHDRLWFEQRPPRDFDFDS